MAQSCAARFALVAADPASQRESSRAALAEAAPASASRWQITSDRFGALSTAQGSHDSAREPALRGGQG